MERFAKDASFHSGEMVRVQKDNIPPEARDEGLVPLRIGGLGHAVAFRYNKKIKVLAMQFDNRAVSPNLFVEYLREVDASFQYRLEPLVRADAWERYNDGKPRKFVIAIAAPSNLSQVEGEVGALTDAGRTLGEIADAPMIRIEVSMGTKRNAFLDGDFVGKALKYFTKGEGRHEDIRKLSATVKDEGEPGTDTIDFLDEKLSCKEILELPPRNADKHFAVREAFLKRCYNQHLDYISKTYGPDGEK